MADAKPAIDAIIKAIAMYFFSTVTPSFSAYISSSSLQEYDR
jgi:hypothetical protein